MTKKMIAGGWLQRVADEEEARMKMIHASGSPGKLPAELKSAVIVQAEAFAAQGGGEVGVFRRVGCVGAMITKWDADIGHWLEWTFTVPRDDSYSILVRYASGGTAPRRAATIDRASPGPEYKAIAFKPTGGYCTGADNWASRILGPAVRLKAGTHRLRLTNLGDGLALDYIAIQKAK